MWLYVLVMIIWTAQYACKVETSTQISTACDLRHLPHCRCSSDRKEAECRNFNFNFKNITPDYFPDSLIKLDLASNNLTEITGFHFFKLASLAELHLDKNKINKIREEAFSNLLHLKSLRLENNRFTSVPTEALNHLKSLEFLNLGNNKLTAIPSQAFSNLKNLYVLLLKKNQIVEIEEKAFDGLKSLRILELDNNLLKHFPAALGNLISLQELSISNNKIKYIPGGILQKAPGILLIELQGNPLVGFDPHSFSHLPKLRKLTMSEARELTYFPDFNGTSSLEVLKLDRSSLQEVPTNLCENCPRLKTLDLKWNKLKKIPNLSLCQDLRVLDLAHNYITSLDGNQFKALTQLHDLLLPHNVISKIPREAFFGLVSLQVLNLEGNIIESIHPEAFLGFTQLEDLNLGNNIFPKLPSIGLDRLLHLKTFNNPNLKDFPKPDNFPRIQTLVLSYAYHCCSFLHLVRADSSKIPVQESVLFPTDTEFDMSLWNSSLTDLWPLLQNLSKKFGMEMNKLWDNFGSDFTYPGHLPTYFEEYFEEQEGKIGSSERPLGTVQCLPLPGPFLPCQDLFDWWTLRCGVWIVFLLAMLGNGTVVFVLVFSRNKMDVPRFLVCNLAAADFFMGIYLGFLAVVDASTLGEFRKYAIPWQMSIGCQLAGFLGVLSSELSVYTLAVITLERNYAITHAMHLNKRLSLKHAGYIMACGWCFALIMSLLPLFGISDYRKFAICLPFETETPGSLTYVVFLMIINGVAFLILMGCYLKMYCAIRGSQAWNSNDSRIAKRMALLVFTDFLCWSPIAFFSLTAAFGLQLISLEQAKVFTVFVLPLNSCCNPFLYAILTKQFKKDCILICKAIEESRVTRGIGRCRHSSNFSNRQTPANTNSLVDRSSRDNQHAHQQQCSCSAKLLVDSASETLKRASSTTRTSRKWLSGKMHWLVFCFNTRTDSGRSTGSNHYAFQIAEIQQKTHKRGSSVSSSENFSSSRSDSWRHNHLHHCGIPLRLLDPKKRANSWLVTRKTSQDSNLSSSRNDSSGSATTQSTSTWRMSRSSASSDVRTQIIPNAEVTSNKSRVKPRLTRQSAIIDDSEVVTAPSSPGRLTVRFLTTIPSAAETSMQNEDEALQEFSTFQKKASSDEAISKYLISDQYSPVRDKSTSKPTAAPTPATLFFENLECDSGFSFFVKPSQETDFPPSQTFSSSCFHADKKDLPAIRSAPSLCIPIGFSSPMRSVNENSTNIMTDVNTGTAKKISSLQNLKK